MKALIIDAVHAAIGEELGKYMSVETKMLPTQAELKELIADVDVLIMRVDPAINKEILDAAKTKRYSHARLRRMLLAAWLDLPPAPQEVPYLRVLAAGATGRALLRQMRAGGAPVLTKAADVAALGSAAEELFAQEAARTDLYTLAFPDLHESVCGRDWRTTPVML